MPNITETISLLDELRGKIENWQFENSEDARTYIQYKFPQLQALRQAALEGEKYKEAGERFKTSITKALNDNDNWGELMDDCEDAVVAYKEAIK